MNNYPGELTDNSPETPWNDKPEKHFKISVNTVLQKECTVYSTDYEVIKEKDEDDGEITEHIITNNIVWKEEFEKEYTNIGQLLSILGKISSVMYQHTHLQAWKAIEKSCEGWEIIEEEFINE